MAQTQLLYPLSLTTALTASIPTAAIVLKRAPSRATIQCTFDYGSGGTAVHLHVETSLDDGVTWIEISEFTFASADKREVVNLVSSTSIVAQYAAGTALADDASVGGILGSQYRVNITSTGTYAATTLRVDAVFS
jgi:hypothetical protein